MEDIRVQHYFARKSGDYEAILNLYIDSLQAWYNFADHDALNIVLNGLHSDIKTSEPILDYVFFRLKNAENVYSNLLLLERWAKPVTISADLIDLLWEMMGTTEDAEIAELTSKILVLQVHVLTEMGLSSNFSRWWPSIVQCLSKSLDKRFILAGLKAWLSCINYLNPADIGGVIAANSEDYFRLLENHVSAASKFALQILSRSVTLITSPIDNEFMKYDPNVLGIESAWSKYVSLVEIVGIDTSVHQTLDSLPEFAALLSPESPIPPNWIITLINVGAISSNTEGIRTLVVQLLLEAQAFQLGALALHPKYVARVLYPRFLQTPNFVFINDRCLHSERLEKFTGHYVDALVAAGLSKLREFIYELAHHLLEHSHGFEAPRVLIMDAMVHHLPANSLTEKEIVPLLAAAKATVATYTSRAMADLYLVAVKKLVDVAGPRDISEQVTEDDELIVAQATDQLNRLSYIQRDTVEKLRHQSLSGRLSKPTSVKYQSLLDMIWPLQYFILTGLASIPQSEVIEKLRRTLCEPQMLTSTERKSMAAAVELAFAYIDESNYELCELAFAAFNQTPTRLAALRAYKRSQPRDIPAAYLVTLWSHIQEATLRIIDRELHHEFLDLLTCPGVVKSGEWSEQQKTCFEIVDLSVLRRNLLVPLTLGLQRYRNGTPWVMSVMARIFAFIGSKEYTSLLDEQVAVRFGVYELHWGPPESQARGIAAVYLRGHVYNTEGIDSATYDQGVLEATEDILELAKLDVKITGSFDNIEAHRRVLYYQILIMLQDRWPRERALEIMQIIRASLENEPNPPVRVHAEWLIGLIGVTHLSKTFTEFALSRIDELDANVGIPPRILGSLIRIAMLLYFSSKAHGVAIKDHELIGNALVEHLLPLATSNKAVIRHRAISALYILSKKNLAPQSFKNLVDRIAHASEAGVKGSGYQNEAFLWDVMDLRLGPVCGGICSAVFDREMPNTLHSGDFVLAGRGDILDLGSFWEGPIKPAGKPTLPELVAHREAVVREAVRNSYSADSNSQIQTKSGTFDVDYKARRTSLVVVATLCDKLVNLGAICRLSDALGVSKLAIRDMDVLSDQQFKTTSLTAEKWIPMEQVKEMELHTYLRNKKAEGYTLVGIEQTDTSKILRPNLQFPEKTLLMMGHEKQGIPADILTLLDACVEIEQLGYVRSMNIQTATAVVVQAYNQNHDSLVTKVGYSN